MKPDRQWTHEELQDLSGLELWQRVAEELGWIGIRVLQEREMMTGRHPLHQGAMRWIPEYHRELIPAMMVVEHFRQKWAPANEESGEPTYWVLVDYKGRWQAEIWWGHHDGHVCLFSAHAEQLPLAICRAALMSAYDVPIPQEQNESWMDSW